LPQGRRRVLAVEDHCQGGAPAEKRGRPTLKVILRGDPMLGARRTDRRSCSHRHCGTAVTGRVVSWSMNSWRERRRICCHGPMAQRLSEWFRRSSFPSASKVRLGAGAELWDSDPTHYEGWSELRDRLVALGRRP